MHYFILFALLTLLALISAVFIFQKNKPASNKKNDSFFLRLLELKGDL